MAIKSLKIYLSIENKKCNIVYSGINGSFQVANNPIYLGYLSKETLDAIEEIGIFENITSVANNIDSEKLSIET